MTDLISTRHLTREIPRIGEDPPEEFLLVPKGELETADGERWTLDDDGIRLILQEFARHGTDFEVDYEHASMEPAGEVARGGAPAAAWGRLEARADGLWLASVRWVPPADEQVRTGAYRYFSPVLGVTQSGRIVALRCAGLTNLPRISNLPPLTAAKTDSQGDRHMELTDLAKKMEEHHDAAGKRHQEMMSCMKEVVDCLKPLARGHEPEEGKTHHAKAKGIIDGAIGSRLTPAEGKELHRQLETGRVTAAYVEGLVLAKSPLTGEQRLEAGKLPASFGFTDTAFQACKERGSVRDAATAEDLAVRACRAIRTDLAPNGYDADAVAKSWRDNCERAATRGRFEGFKLQADQANVL